MERALDSNRYGFESLFNLLQPLLKGALTMSHLIPSQDLEEDAHGHLAKRLICKGCSENVSFLLP